MYLRKINSAKFSKKGKNEISQKFSTRSKENLAKFLNFLKFPKISLHFPFEKTDETL